MLFRKKTKTELHNYCKRCNAILDFQQGYDPTMPVWICKGCGMMLTNPSYPEFDNESGIIWQCDGCRDYLQLQTGFSEECGEWKCKKCGFVNKIAPSEVFESDQEYQSALKNPTRGMSEEDVLKLSSYQTVQAISEKHEVYLVRNVETGRLFVRKTLKVYDRNVLEYLKAEPVEGTPQIVEIFEGSNSLTVIEQYIEGGTIEELLRNGPLDEGAATAIIGGVCAIVNILHNCPKPIIHRDIKPSNVMISEEGIFLIDMDAAKWYHEDETMDTVLIGTQRYAAPEQYGFGASSVATDIYAIGVLLNVMLTGQYPSEKLVDGELGDIVKKCTQMNPEDRYRSAEELLNTMLKYRKRFYSGDNGQDE